MHTPQAHAEDSLAQARVMFRAVLAPWASDLLELRRRGLDRPGFRRCLSPTLRPRASGSPHIPALPAGIRRAA